MLACGGCSKPVSPQDVATCMICKRRYHEKCANLPPAGYLPGWICNKCGKRLSNIFSKRPSRDEPSAQNMDKTPPEGQKATAWICDKCEPKLRKISSKTPSKDEPSAQNVDKRPSEGQKAPESGADSERNKTRLSQYGYYTETFRVLLIVIAVAIYWYFFV